LRLRALPLSILYKKRMASQAPNVCFYSTRCRWSDAFIKEIKQTPFVKEVAFVCVDPGADGKRPKLPSWLKQVPTLVVKGEDEPRTNGEVMNWLSERKLLANAGPGATAMEPEPWTSGEMGGSLTKGYALIGAAGDTAPIGNFAFLNGADAVATKTASDMPGGGLGARGQGGDKTKKERLFDSQMENYMKERSSGMPPPVMRQ
jgi:hypothetical protein